MNKFLYIGFHVLMVVILILNATFAYHTITRIIYGLLSVYYAHKILNMGLEKK